MEKLVVIDGNSLANRAFYGVPILSNSKGVIVNAVYGFANMLMNLLSQEQPEYIAVAFDIGRKVFRHEQYEDYKAQRKGMPDELRSQMPLIKEVLQKMNIAIFQLEGYEGDDLIGTMVRWAEKKGFESIIVTGDKDIFQLIDENTRVYMTRKGLSEVAIYDKKALADEYQLSPDQIRDLKGLMGDASDNIPGVPGIGEKTALKLLREYQSVENLYEHLEDFAGKKMGEKLAANQEQALMSKELATIFCEVPITFEAEQMRYQAPDVEALRGLYRELELNTLLKNLDAQYQETLQVETIAGKSITSVQEATALFEQLASDELVILLRDKGTGVGKSLVTDIGLLLDGQAYHLACQDNFGQYAQALKPYLEDEHILKVTDDAKKLYWYFLREGIDVGGVFWDSVLSAYLLNPERKDLSLGKLLDEYMNVQLSPDEPQRLYGELAHLEELCRQMTTEMDDLDLLSLYGQIELPLSKILARMELEGVRLDKAYLEMMGKELDGRLKTITDHIYALAGGEFNINSPKQLGVLLFETLGLPVIKKTKTGYSTDAEVLDTLAEEHDIVREILNFRQLSKLKSTYVDGLTNLIDQETDKVHTTFNQTITATGRLSSTEPNLQNIPIKTEEGKRIRKAFIPTQKGNLLLAADYSQIELRIMAHMSQDPVLVESFRNNEDIHTRTAAEVFGVPMEAVTKAQRRNAKAVNFGIIYGQSDYGLSKELGIPRQEAKQYIEGYFEKYSGVRQWIDQTIAQVLEDGYITTMFGRRRYINDINSKNFNLRSFAERTAVNTPIQGSAADIIKIAMIKIDALLRAHQFKAKMILQVHDELIFEVAPPEAANLIKLIRSCMEEAAELIVPLKVDVNVGFNWYDMERV